MRGVVPKVVKIDQSIFITQANLNASSAPIDHIGKISYMPVGLFCLFCIAELSPFRKDDHRTPLFLHIM